MVASRSVSHILNMRWSRFGGAKEPHHSLGQLAKQL